MTITTSRRIDAASVVALTISLISLAVSPARGQPPDSAQIGRAVAPVLDSLNQSQAAAAVGLDWLRAATAQPAGQGVLSTQAHDSVLSATLGPPLAVFVIPLDQLRASNPDLATLLANGRRAYYPVLIGRTPRAVVTVRKYGAQWRAAEIDGEGYAQLVFGARDLAARAPGLLGLFVVEVQFLNIDFLGVWTTQGLDLIPFVNDRRGRWRQRIPVPARTVFRALVPEARAYNGRPN